MPFQRFLCETSVPDSEVRSRSMLRVFAAIPRTSNPVVKSNGPVRGLLGLRGASRWQLRPIALLSAIYLSLFAHSTPFAQPITAVGPSDIEAAYLYNFGKFVRFPPVEPQDTPPNSTPYSICILGEDTFGGMLDSLVANESIEGRRIVIRRVASPAAADNCQIAFIAPSEASRQAKDLQALEKKPILTVSSLPGFLDHGGMIQFMVRDSKVRFAVNLFATGRAGLSLSSELLKVAVRVDSKPALEAK
jgi:hypothetical protein